MRWSHARCVRPAASACKYSPDGWLSMRHSAASSHEIQAMQADTGRFFDAQGPGPPLLDVFRDVVGVISPWVRVSGSGMSELSRNSIDACFRFSVSGH